MPILQKKLKSVSKGKFSGWGQLRVRIRTIEKNVKFYSAAQN